MLNLAIMKIKLRQDLFKNRYLLASAAAIVLVLIAVLIIFLVKTRFYFKNSFGWKKSGTTLTHVDPKTNKKLSSLDVKTVNLKSNDNVDKLKTDADADCTKNAKKNNAVPSFSGTTFQRITGFKCFYESDGTMQNSIYYLPNLKNKTYYLITIYYPKENRQEIARVNSLINSLVLR